MDDKMLDLMEKMYVEMQKGFKEVRGEMQEGLQAVRGEMQEGLQAVRGEMQEGFKAVRSEMQKGLQEVRGEMQEGLQAVRGEMREGFKEVRGEIRDIKLNAIRLENKMDNNFKALFDGYAQNTERLGQLESKVTDLASKVERQELEIRVIKGGKD